MNASDQAYMDEIDDNLFDDEDDDEPVRDFAYSLNSDHFVRMTRRGQKLLVVFEAAPQKTDDLAEHRPSLEDLGEEMGYSVLSLVSRGHTWFRDEQVIAFFDAMVDGTILDGFDDVLLYGASSAGHAALSYSICAPLSRVLALSPQTALRAADMVWDTRFPQAQDVDFEGRYPARAEYLAIAQEIYAAYDPQVENDARHMELLDAGSVLPLVCRRLGTNLERIFQEFGILEDVVSDAMEGELSEVGFYKTLRARRNNPAYLRSLVGKLIEADRPYLEALVVRNIGERLGRGRFTRRFEQLEAELAEKGITVPPSRLTRN